MDKAMNAVNGIYKTYLYKTVIKDASKVALKAWKKRDDADYFLRKIGLSQYKPVKSTFGSIGFFLFGALAGGVAALLLAPMPGDKMRTEVKDRMTGLIDKVNLDAKPELGARA